MKTSWELVAKARRLGVEEERGAAAAVEVEVEEEEEASVVDA